MKYYLDEMKNVKPWDTQEESFKEDESGRWYVEDEEVYNWWMQYDEALTIIDENLSPEELREKESYMSGDLNEYIWLADELRDNN